MTEMAGMSCWVCTVCRHNGEANPYEVPTPVDMITVELMADHLWEEHNIDAQTPNRPLGGRKRRQE